MFSFNTKVLFLLAKFVKHFEKDVDRIMKVAFGEIEDTNTLFKLVFDLIASLPEAEDTAIELLAAASNRPVTEIRTMDGYEFVKQFRLFLTEVDWNKLLGESLGLAVKAPPKSEIQPQTVS